MNGSISIEHLTSYSEADARDLGQLLTQLNTYSDGAPILADKIQFIVDSPTIAQLVARDQGRIIGAATLSIVAKIANPNVGYLEEFVVDENYRGKGVSQALWQAMLDWCKQNQLSAIEFTSSYKKQAAHSFYLRNGAEIRDTAHFIKKLD